MKTFCYALSIILLCCAAFSIVLADEITPDQWAMLVMLLFLSAIIFWLFAIVKLKDEQLEQHKQRIDKLSQG